MPAFYIPEGKSIALDGEYAMERGLNWATFMENFVQIDQPISPKQIALLEADGFVRADTYWYTIEPEPVRDEQGPVLRALGQHPSTTIPPHVDAEGKLRVSFRQAVDDTAVRKLRALGYTIQSAAASSLGLI